MSTEECLPNGKITLFFFLARVCGCRVYDGVDSRCDALRGCGVCGRDSRSRRRTHGGQRVASSVDLGGGEKEKFIFTPFNLPNFNK